MAAAKHLFLLLMGMLSAAPVGAQCRLCDQQTTARPADTPTGDVDLQLETTLNFDRLILSGMGQGAAIIRPTGTNSAEGTVLQIGPRASVGTVVVHGEANRELTVDMPHRIELYSGTGGRISLLEARTPRVVAEPSAPVGQEIAEGTKPLTMRPERS